VSDYILNGVCAKCGWEVPKSIPLTLGSSSRVVTRTMDSIVILKTHLLEHLVLKERHVLRNGETLVIDS
jgi:hypothetical protein